MRIGMLLSYSGDCAETVSELADYEKAGLDIVFVPEAYGFDAVSQLGFIAARTERLEVLRACGVTTLNVAPMAGSAAERVRLIERIRDLAG
jgi:alkanesulfonate monooxygenase SsuD/methylene tetrahydromethanopterin reductase-like flavin-dependent oxidoreductase (luciferase family)